MELTASRANEILKKHGFSFTKSIGQNFLINPSVPPKMAAGSGCDGIGVLEVGPGAGMLTNELAKRAKKVVAVELDKRLSPVLAETIGDLENVEIVFSDALKLDLPAFIKEHFGDMPVVVCANLPFYISTELIMRFLESGAKFKGITVLLQKELAVRLCAVPPSRECGAVSVTVHYRSKPEILFDVSRGSFLPAPNVDCQVIRLNIYDEPPVKAADESTFFKVVRAAFNQRRKTLHNSLSVLSGKEKAAAVLAAADIDPRMRAEQLSVADFCRLADAYQ
ncbi:MAG TPA: 16S rRNA (adenine(1518)-N(6)/adenine(1519)-N(6))-dimethyltransferase RsmA [Oscillospiraceae bacterium]|nr:16S rRNA (adenine(1518)-N(6)/adenine(1519)-N(6))-dimethyltransferase RsmA [Oscillospiraceae bacterium]HPF55398.1 16S rRNA (adenine(1518)-N(6)/adenine(1519)-N(6))-dimethyltransferase RsmA [Clostridiales bacterium]HPK35610.1 16S rRNA (adenine(1518)-N(6)/adenine(1519)-N(6))-dimethyltransferase RsmA [Oscillospiraceae bacterium]HPR74674.1 16S rRNA (adenine(1518)-N(6)/adenine(1519)-N(6))-dimethyltransferase RsmA [Oscillospiraceae bacterium]